MGKIVRVVDARIDSFGFLNIAPERLLLAVQDATSFSGRVYKNRTQLVPIALANVGARILGSFGV